MAILVTANSQPAHHRALARIYLKGTNSPALSMYCRPSMVIKLSPYGLFGPTEIDVPQTGSLNSAYQVPALERS